MLESYLFSIIIMYYLNNLNISSMKGVEVSRGNDTQALHEGIRRHKKQKSASRVDILSPFNLDEKNHLNVVWMDAWIARESKRWMCG